MSGYGSNVTSDGKPIGADSDFIPPSVGIQENVILKSIEVDREKGRCVFEFVQADGAVVRHTEFDGEEDWQIDTTNRRVKHIATRFVTEEEYHAAVEGSKGFLDFSSRVKNLIDAKNSEDIKFRMIFRYDKNYKYVVLPQYPNFIELMSVEESKLVITNYDQGFLKKPSPDEEAKGASDVDSEY